MLSLAKKIKKEIGKTKETEFITKVKEIKKMQRKKSIDLKKSYFLKMEKAFKIKFKKYNFFLVINY